MPRALEPDVHDDRHQHVLPGMKRDAAGMFAHLITEQAPRPSTDDHAGMLSAAARQRRPNKQHALASS